MIKKLIAIQKKVQWSISQAELDLEKDVKEAIDGAKEIIALITRSQ